MLHMSFCLLFVPSSQQMRWARDGSNVVVIIQHVWCAALYRSPPDTFGGCSRSRCPRRCSPGECFRWHPAAERSPQPSSPGAADSRRDTNEKKEKKNEFKLWTFIRLQLMIKWGPLSWLPRGVYLCRAMETLTDNAASELKNSLNNCPGVGLVQSEGIGYRYQASLGWAHVCVWQD